MGRPKSLSADVESYLRSLFPELKTARSLQNRRAMLRAVGLLKGNPLFARLVPPGVAAGADRLPLSVLAELGRVADDAELREIALEVCRLGDVGGRAAVGYVRAVRLAGRRKPADAVALGVTIDRAIVDYRRQHPDTTGRQVRAALINLLDAYADEE